MLGWQPHGPNLVASVPTAAQCRQYSDQGDLTDVQVAAESRLTKEDSTDRLKMRGHARRGESEVYKNVFRALTNLRLSYALDDGSLN